MRQNRTRKPEPAPLKRLLLVQIQLDDLFNADIWVGQAAVGLGLVDGLAHLKPKLMELYGEKVRLVPLTQKRSGSFFMGSAR